MALPLMPPIEPQLARGRPELPIGGNWAYEPKYDGFRALAFVDGDQLTLQSLERYFPELRFPAGRYVLDGEIVIDSEITGADEPQDFDALSARIHPAASRIELLSQQTPARYVAFDLLASDDEVLLDQPLAERRRRLEALALPGVSLTPLVRSAAAAEAWLEQAEGVVAKDLTAAYAPGKRTTMVKVKRTRTVDAIVTGYRPGKEPGTVGSLILGLYDAAGELQVVGHCSGIKPAEKRALRERLAAHETGARGHGDASRWKSEKELEWIALEPDLVIEVSFEQTSGGRIRHGTKLLRWCEDKQLGPECSSSSRRELSRRRVLEVAVAAAALGRIHRRVGKAHHVVGRQRPDRLKADQADAGGDPAGGGGRQPAGDALDVVEQRLCDQIGACAAGVGEQHRELIATEPAEHVGCA
jgi:ATP-dependent DNA ligase